MLAAMYGLCQTNSTGNRVAVSMQFLVTCHARVRYVNAQTARFFPEYNLNSSLFVIMCVLTVAPTLGSVTSWSRVTQRRTSRLEITAS